MHTASPSIDSKTIKHSYTKSTIMSPLYHHPSAPNIEKAFPKIKIKTQKTEMKLSSLPEEIKNRQKDFLEMLGLGERSPVSTLYSPLHTNKVSPKISVTDLMGTQKYNFLKQSGFLPVYHECKRVEEFKRLVDEKNVLNYANIVHTDMIRENFFKHEQNKVTEESSVPFKRSLNRRKTTKKVLQIEEIYKKCDRLSTEMKSVKKSIDLPFIEPKSPGNQKKSKRKLTVEERNSILLNMQQIGG